MEKHQNKYYQDMFKKSRAMCFKDGDRLGCVLTFYICNDPNPYITRDNQWQEMDDNPEGYICYVDHMIADNHKNNKKLSYNGWKTFKDFIKKEYPNVTHIRWNHWKNNKLYVYFRKLERRRQCTK